MASISTVSYVLSVSEKGTPDEKLTLQDLSGRNILDIFQSFIKDNSLNYGDNDHLEKLFLFDAYDRGFYPTKKQALFEYISGTMKTGTYGVEAELVDKNTGNVSYNKNEDDAEVMPFHFIMAIPIGDTNKGVVVLQKNGIYGIKTLIQAEFSRYLITVDSDYKLALGNIAPATYLDQILKEGIVSKVRFIRFGKPRDISKRFGLNLGTEELYDEYVVKKPIGFARRYSDKLKSCVRGQSNVIDVVELNGFDYNDIKLEINFKGKAKTVTLSDPTSTLFNDDITEDVELVGGHPTIESTSPILSDTAKTYLEEMGLIAME